MVVRQTERALSRVGAIHHSNTPMASRGRRQNAYGPTPSHVLGTRSLSLRRLCANPRTCYAFVGSSWKRRAGQLVGDGVGSSWSCSDFSICSAVGFVADSQAPPLKVCSHRRQKMQVVSTPPDLQIGVSPRRRRRLREPFGQRSKCWQPPRRILPFFRTSL